MCPHKFKIRHILTLLWKISNFQENAGGYFSLDHPVHIIQEN